MAIKVDVYQQLRKSSSQRGTQTYDYTFDSIQKQLINDDFFDEIGFTEYIETDTTIRTQLFHTCDYSSIPFMNSIRKVIPCTQQLSISIAPGYKFGTHNYRYKDGAYGWVCNNIFQDMVKVSIAIKGTSFSPEIGDIVDETGMIKDAMNFIRSIVYDDYELHCQPDSISKQYDFTEFLNYSDASVYIVKQPSIDLGLINTTFSNVSCQQECQIIPKNFKKAIDKNTVHEIQFECTVEDTILVGRIVDNVKVIESIGGLVPLISYGDSSSTDQPESLNVTSNVQQPLNQVIDTSSYGLFGFGHDQDTSNPICNVYGHEILDLTNPIVWTEVHLGIYNDYSIDNFIRLSGNPDSYIISNSLTDIFSNTAGAVGMWIRVPEIKFGYICGEIAHSGCEFHCYLDQDGRIVFRMKNISGKKFVVRSDESISINAQNFIYPCQYQGYMDVYGKYFGHLYVNTQSTYVESQLKWDDSIYYQPQRLGVGCLNDKGTIKYNLECDISLLRYYDSLNFETCAYQVMNNYLQFTTMYNQ